jgi:hypothetical protein
LITAAGRLDPVDKIYPRLQRLIAAHAAGELPPNPENPEYLVRVYVTAAGGDFSSLAASGYDLVNELAGSVIVILPIDQIATLAARDDVTAVIAPAVGRPLAAVHTVDQKAVKLAKAYDVESTERPAGTRGAGVVVGIVDSGVCMLHDAFRAAVSRLGRSARFGASKISANVTCGFARPWRNSTSKSSLKYNGNRRGG